MEISKKSVSVIMAIGFIGSASAANFYHKDTASNATTTHNISYTASGTMSKEKALLLKHLLKNNKNLEIHAEVTTPRPIHKRSVSKRPIEVSVNYTVKGKTTVANVKKLMRLLKTHKHIEIVAEANIDLNQTITTRYTRPNMQYAQPWSNYQYNTTGSYPIPGNMPYQYGYGYGYQQYGGYMIQPVAQPMIWYRVPVNYQNPTQIVEQYQVDNSSSVLVAEN